QPLEPQLSQKSHDGVEFDPAEVIGGSRGPPRFESTSADGIRIRVDSNRRCGFESAGGIPLVPLLWPLRPPYAGPCWVRALPTRLRPDRSSNPEATTGPTHPRARVSFPETSVCIARTLT